MKQATRLNAIVICVLVLTACYKFDKIIVLVNGDDVAFTLPDADLGSIDTKFMVNVIDVVTTGDCKKDCVTWEVIRPADSNLNFIEENFVKFPIKYGSNLPNMQTRILKPLHKGSYRVGAQIAIIRNGEVIDTKKLAAVFKIE